MIMCILLVICFYLFLNRFSVCKRWNELAKEDILWIKVDAHVKSPNEVAKLIKRLPKIVTHLRICCSSLDVRLPLWLPDVTAALRRRCPNLESLIIEKVFFQEQSCDVRIRTQDEKKFHRVCLPRNPPDEDDDAELFCASCASEESTLDQFAPEYLPEKLRVMSLRDSQFFTSHFECRIDVLIPHIEVLDLSPYLCVTENIVPFFSRLTNLTELYLPRCPVTSKGIEKLLQVVTNLKVLDLENTGVCSETFKAIKRYGQSLEKLYFGSTFVEDSYLTYENENEFDNLRILCLRSTYVTPQGLKRLFYFYPHLHSVDVSQCEVEEIWTNQRYFFMHSKLLFNNNACCDHFRKNNHHK